MKILQFSGGIDSLACLLLLKDEPGLNVATVQTDGGYPSVELYLGKIREEFPHIPFHIKRTERHLKVLGSPVDVIPLRWTSMGQLQRGGTDVRYQDSASCCNRALWQPMQALCLELGATVIYRGQRNDDRLRAQYYDGHSEDGIEYRLPIGTWTRNMVIKYVDEHAPHLMPPGYDQGEKTSRDCMDCTAYLQDNWKRIGNLPKPVYDHVNGVIRQWRADVMAELGA